METTFSLIIGNSEAVFLFTLFSLAYLVRTDFKLQKNGVFYFGGLLLMMTALFLSHAVETTMPFTMHMSIHILLLLICAPLMVIGWPAPKRSQPPLLKKTGSFLLTHPLLCWITGIGIMWFWHIPTVFEALITAHHQAFSFLPITHSGSLLIAGLIFIWPIVHPDKDHRIDPPIGIVYLFTACIACSLLGMLITFAPPETYQTALNRHTGTPMHGTLDPASDQQAAGLMMWVPCCFLYLFGVLYIALNWLKEPNRQQINTQRASISATILIPKSHDEYQKRKL